jgi:nitroimidazol reductase NimA-like FMN-containing flavoprotein (pyridoxamine 5'-phosphate oxidase superfamily)
MKVDQAGYEILTETECLNLLSQSDRGRIAITVAALPTILPVRFALDGDRIVLSTGPGTILARATDRNVVAFQVDGVDPDSGEEWSVSLIGVAEHLTEAEDVARARALSLPDWSQDGPVFVAIGIERVSGRRAVQPPGLAC